MSVKKRNFSIFFQMYLHSNFKKHVVQSQSFPSKSCYDSYSFHVDVSSLFNQQFHHFSMSTVGRMMKRCLNQPKKLKSFQKFNSKVKNSQTHPCKTNTSVTITSPLQSLLHFFSHSFTSQIS
jgi:hypothetical protein